MTAAPITELQLAHMYAAANQANRDLSKALCEKPRNRNMIEILRQRSRDLNSEYDAARRRYKKQQKAANREAQRIQIA